MVAAYRSFPICAPVKSLIIEGERVPGSYVSVYCHKVLLTVLPLQIICILLRSHHTSTDTSRKVIVITLAVF